MAIGTALTVAGLATSAAGTASNFIQAGKERRAADRAADEAAKALEAARDKLQVNYLKGLSIQKEPYELARESGISTAAQIVQAAQEGDQRGVAAGATRAALAQQNLENRNRMAMGQELQGIQRAAALEDRRLQTQLSNLDLGEARGFQSMAADARDRQRELNQAGAEGLIGVGKQLAGLPELYGGGSGLETETVANSFTDDGQPLRVSSQLVDDPNSRFFRMNSGEVVDLSEKFKGNMSLSRFPDMNIFQDTLPGVSALPEISADYSLDASGNLLTE
tara:strand:- start:12591 stop:13424 length:834 start_codon:yes stop_codon:yes gene_type:complete